MTKLVPMDEALAGVRDGSHVALGGFAITRNVIAAVHELIRSGRHDLVVTQCVGGMDTDLLAAAGCIRTLAYSGGSLDRFGVLHSVNRAVLAGTVEVQEYSSLALSLRLHAAALGLPFVATRTMLGSDVLQPLLASGDVRQSTNPFTDEPVVLLAPLRPDVAIVHADAADEDGNVTFAGASWTTRETAFAAREVVVVCEEIVPAGALAAEDVYLPGAVVTAVVHVPRGAHPTAVHGRYRYDRAHLSAYAATIKEGPEATDAYLDRFVRSVGSHAEYLELVGATA